MRSDEEAQAAAVPAEEGETAANGRTSLKDSDAAEKPAGKLQGAVRVEDRIEVKLEGKEHPWNWSKTR
jgi:hypothetical protein